jgi:hypothetical protein
VVGPYRSCAASLPLNSQESVQAFERSMFVSEQIGDSFDWLFAAARAEPLRLVNKPRLSIFKSQLAAHGLGNPSINLS